MKRLLIALSCFITVSVYSQSITNTLGSNGLFTIKDASNNYLTLNQINGQVNILRTLRLENTTSSTTGVMFKSADRFLHTYGFGNIFLGINSGNFTMTGTGNIGIGYTSFYSNTTGSSNTALGYQSLYFNNTGYENTAVGNNSLFYNNIGYQNTAVGNNSLQNNTSGNYNTALGVGSLYNNYNGNENTALGSYSLRDNYNGINNTAVGSSSLLRNTGGTNNTAVGYQSMNYNNSGFQNTAIGYRSLYNSTGNYNTALGHNAGSTITTGANLTCIGIDAAPSSATAIDQVTLGNGFVQSLRCNVQTISSLSDARDKKNITDLTLGLDFLMKVKPRQFNWDKREWYEGNKSDGSKMKETFTAGFISQELDEAQTTENADWLNLVLKDNPEKLEATYGNLLPVMVKAIQELNVKSEKLRVESIQLKSENKELKENNEKLSSEVESLKQMKEQIVKLEKMMNEMNSVKHTSINKDEVNMTNSK
jgi:hypothetical protein